MLDSVARRQLIRYGMVGLIVNVIGYLSFLGMVYAGLHHQVAATLMFAIAVLASYVANRNWSFAHQGGVARSFSSYLVLYIAAWVLDVLVLYIFVDRLGWHHALVQGVAILGIAGLLFVGQRYWVFRQARSTTPGSGATS
ncbi:MAG: GtrA family protein [Phycisphaerales bacterium]|nr:GtrA family protein [Phycisphaerales bacterium]